MMMKKQSIKLREKQKKNQELLQMKKKAEQHLKSVLRSVNKNNNNAASQSDMQILSPNMDSIQNESNEQWSTQHIIKVMIQRGMF